MAYRPGMTVYTGNTIEIPGMGANYTLKWKFTCNSKTYEDTIATGQSADTYKWRIPSSTFTPLFGLNVKGELHVYVYPNGSSTFGFGDYTYTLVLDPSIAPKIDYVRSSLAGKIYNNKAISLYTTISISFKVARVDGAMQTVKISDGRITYQMNVSQGSGYAEITQPFSTYTVPDDETNEYIDVNFSIDTIDARGRKASKTFTERVYKYVKPACKIRAVRNDDNTRISVYYEPVCQATVAEKANNITKIIGWIVTDDENNPQTLDLTNLASPQMLPGTVNSNESYMVRVAVIDSVELSNTAEIISQGDSPIMDIGRDGKTVTFFGSSPSSADEYSVQIGKKLYGKVIFNENNIKFNYNQVEMFHLGYDIFTDDDGTHAVKKFVFGDRNDVKGQLSSAIGVNNNVIGECGIALGSSNAVSGVCSSAIGRKLKASGDNQTVIGQYNIDDTTNEYSFIVGNGTSDNYRSNAFAVKRNGDVEINGNSVNKCFGGEVGHWYDNTMNLIASTSHSVLNAFTDGVTSKLNSLISKNSNTKITIKRNGLYAFMLRAHVAPRTANNRVEIAPFINGSRLAMYCRSVTAGVSYTVTTIIPYILKLSAGDTVEIYAKLIDNANSIEVTLGDVMMYALDYEGKFLDSYNADNEINPGQVSQDISRLKEDVIKLQQQIADMQYVPKKNLQKIKN